MSISQFSKPDMGWSCFLRRWLLLSIAVVVSVSATGCVRNPALRQLLDQPIIDYRDMVWARRAYNLRYGNCDRRFGNHFEEGFVAGYCSVCEGGDGYVPALPPEEYWGYEYQSAEGSQCVNAWFEGYPLGAAAARKDRAGNYRDVYISKMVDKAVTMEKAPKLIQGKPAAPAATEEVKINPDLKLNAPPKPVGTSSFNSGRNSTVHRTPLLFSRTAPDKIPVDPTDNTPLPMTLRPNTVRTASGASSPIVR